ncbi:Smr/MutS family protein [Nitratireductor sp. ZSWI3]|uniref:Smr/MutS family protein n=1 Tax=Nitratireductor sp. ZSWI3 TaxID=2966359 RepID=UPI00214F7971|nr:Smr/MutS family protein [Nitratireductor sp. ZSWI3]MCR4265675.1 Smr/MutS family protein [Nitratireductor sp. ZSWI3]
MTRHTPKRLSLEDRILWNKVARTTEPLKGKVLEELPMPADDAMEELSRLVASDRSRAVARAAAAPQEVKAKAHPVRKIDQPTHNKLARGRLAIEGRVDLHGLTQSEAHGLLLSFLSRAHAEGLRHVLVITGKGASLGSEGVLRRALPQWLATPPFSHLVSGIDEASRRHGGGGAFYIRIKRHRRDAS